MRLIAIVPLILFCLLTTCTKSPTDSHLPHDTTPPAAIRDLTTLKVTPSRITFAWTAVGDDSTSGEPFRYDARYASFPITDSNWFQAIEFSMVEFHENGSGRRDTFTLTHLQSNQQYYLALKTADSSQNWSGISNVVKATTSESGTIFRGVTSHSIAPYALVSLFAARDAVLYFCFRRSVVEGNPLAAFNLSNPSFPYYVSWPSQIDCVEDVQAYGDKLFVLSRCCGWACGPAFLTVASSPAPYPMILGVYGFEDVQYGNRIRDHLAIGQHVFLACTDSLMILDATDPQHMTVEKRYDLPQGLHATQLRAMDSVLVVFGEGSTVGLLAASNPDRMSLISVFDAGVYVGNVEICDARLCIVHGAGELQLVDITNPAQPRPEGHLMLPKYPLSMATHRNFLILPDSSQVYAVPMGDAMHPSIIDSCDFPVHPQKIVADGRYVYVFDLAGDIDILECSR